MKQERNSNRIIPFNSYVLVCNIEPVPGFKVKESNITIKVFRGKLAAAPVLTEKELNQGEWIYFRMDTDDRNELERMFPCIECSDSNIAGLPTIMITKDKILFVLLESRSGIVLPKISTSSPTRVQ
jgi:hypothetical protein